MERVQHIPSAIILQFASAFGVWIIAEHVGLSAVLTTVCFAITAARAPERVPGRIRIPTYAVWDTVVFALNVLAFIFIGLQIRPILANLDAVERDRYFGVAVAVLVTVVVVRAAWHMPVNAIIRWRHRRVGFNPPRPMLRPTVGSGIVISWAGMRGIVTLAGALALPARFPYRDLVVLTAFFVVLGTLIIQGLTLKPLLRWLNLPTDDPVNRETQLARERALAAGLARMSGDQSPTANAVRHQLKAVLAPDTNPGATRVALQTADLHRRVVDAARHAVLEMRATDEIGDDAFHAVEEQLDRFEAALESD